MIPHEHNSMRTIRGVIKEVRLGVFTISRYSIKKRISF